MNLNKPLTLIIATFLLSFQIFANPCERFVNLNLFKLVQPISLDGNMCLIDINFKKYLHFDAEQTTKIKNFGVAHILSSKGEKFALVTDVVSLFPKKTDSEIQPKIVAIGAAIATCINNPVCSSAVAAGAWWAAKKAAVILAEGFLFKFFTSWFD